MKTEFRLVWKRVGGKRKVRRFVRRKALDRFVTLLGPEPWKAFDKEPEDLVCCRGFECMCQGATVRQDSDAKREGMPPIESIHVETRYVGNWAKESA